MRVARPGRAPLVPLPLPPTLPPAAPPTLKLVRDEDDDDDDDGYFEEGGFEEGEFEEGEFAEAMEASREFTASKRDGGAAPASSASASASAPPQPPTARELELADSPTDSHVVRAAKQWIRQPGLPNPYAGPSLGSTFRTFASWMSNRGETMLRIAKADTFQEVRNDVEQLVQLRAQHRFDEDRLAAVQVNINAQFTRVGSIAVDVVARARAIANAHQRAAITNEDIARARDANAEFSTACDTVRAERSKMRAIRANLAECKAGILQFEQMLQEHEANFLALTQGQRTTAQLGRSMNVASRTKKSVAQLHVERMRVDTMFQQMIVEHVGPRRDKAEVASKEVAGVLEHVDLDAKIEEDMLTSALTNAIQNALAAEARLPVATAVPVHQAAGGATAAAASGARPFAPRAALAPMAAMGPGYSANVQHAWAAQSRAAAAAEAQAAERDRDRERERAAHATRTAMMQANPT